MTNHEKQAQLIASIHQLDFFYRIDQVEVISAGLSHPCFAVTCGQKKYFAKDISLNHPNYITHFSRLAAKSLLTPEILYLDPQWLISPFVEPREQWAKHSLSQHITVAIKLMTQCHQLGASLPKLEMSQVIGELVQHINLHQPNSLNSRLFEQIAQEIKKTIGYKHAEVNCHGDVTFDNILIDHNNTAWLIDFECVCQAPAEFDLAMFIAINNLKEDSFFTVINRYQQESSLKISTQLTRNYLSFCYCINALYLSRLKCVRAT